MDTQWKEADKELPEDGISVLCYHSFSGNYFICYRTRDCFSDEPKWYGGAKPTHWRFLDKPESL